MPIDATLARLVLTTPQPQVMAEFYQRAFAYDVQLVDATWRCEGPSRSLWLRPGPAQRLAESHFSVSDAAALDRLAARMRAAGVERIAHGDASAKGFSVQDPDGRRLCFAVAPDRPVAPGSEPLQARLQHYAVRSPAPERLAQFYIDRLGFTPSDWVRDAAGDVTAVFLRTDAEHHALAIFRAAEARFDHFSCETRDWNSVRDWADELARRGVLLAWGVGRHGPGNDTFLMVADPDGNMAEISAELEICSDDRQPGLWPHHPQTLNRWGQAIMRS